jgi:catechol 2,3-dioxygenase-like lactoylglutathione lyase family enzyme
MPSLHHIAFACQDVAETDHFYQEILGFPLAHAQLDEAKDGGWLRHTFYDLGDGSYIAFFDLHGVGEPAELRTEISTGLGLPAWVNHVAIRADAAKVDEVKARLDKAGLAVEMELDHGWCQSLYVTDPNGILVELTVDTPGIDPDPEQARRIVEAAEPGDLAPEASP